MITVSGINAYLRAVPFRPFRLHMASGRTFDIKHPEMISIGKTDLRLFSLVNDDSKTPDNWELVSLMLIESISFLSPVPSKP